jgi:hypothetical protein
MDKEYSSSEKRALRKLMSKLGKKSAAGLTPAERKARALKAVKARWGKRK